MIKKFRLQILPLLLAILMLLTSCGNANRTPETRLEAICRAEKPLPAGRLYVRSAPQDSDRHLSDELLAAIFGDGRLPPELEKTSDIAIFLSYTHPFEAAVFLCKNADATDAIAELCLRRLDILKNNRTDLPMQEEVAAYFANAEVRVIGRWVVLVVSSDPDAAFRAFRRSS